MTALRQQVTSDVRSFFPYLPEERDRRILIVDDEQMMRDLFATFLSERYLCTVASDVPEALAALERHEFGLILSDVSMPGLSGIELLRKVVERYPETAVIMVSGVDRSQRVLDAVRLGAYDYLIKPCELDVLSFAVERALERRALLSSARRYKQDLERRNDELRTSKAALERLQAQIVHSEKMASLGQLAAGVAHELNNPAGFIFGNMAVLKECAVGLERLLSFYENVPYPTETEAQLRELKDEIDYENTLAELHDIIKDCHDGAARIRDVVQNLRVFSRLDEAEFKKVDIHEGIESTIRLLSRYYGPGCIQLQRDYDDLPLVDCYAGQLNQVWMNLLVNAAQAVAKVGGVVKLTTFCDADRVVVSIIDNGCGISPEHLPRVFDPFFTTKPVGEGTGLGLSVTHSIIGRHRGAIEVKSTRDVGTTFTVRIPIHAPRCEEKGAELVTS